jgi:hypothetical protein
MIRVQKYGCFKEMSEFSINCLGKLFQDTFNGKRSGTPNQLNLFINELLGVKIVVNVVINDSSHL